MRWETAVTRCVGKRSEPGGKTEAVFPDTLSPEPMVMDSGARNQTLKIPSEVGISGRDAAIGGFQPAAEPDLELIICTASGPHASPVSSYFPFRFSTTPGSARVVLS